MDSATRAILVGTLVGLAKGNILSKDTLSDICSRIDMAAHGTDGEDEAARFTDAVRQGVRMD